MDRSWMYTTGLRRQYKEYRDGVLSFIKAAEEDRIRRNDKYMCCPCSDCRNEILWEDEKEVHAHLIRRGFMERYTCWVMMHGEQDLGTDGAAADGSGADNHEEGDEEEHDMFVPSPLGGEIVDVDPDMLQDMLRDVDDPAMNERDSMKFSRLVSDSETPLYAGCKPKHTKLSATLDLMKLKASSGWSDKSFTELLGILKDMLPQENTLPETTYEAKQVLCPLGLEVRRIHACPNDCILYHKQYANLDACLVCKASRYKRKKSAGKGKKSKRGGPAKVVWYLPIIDHFKRIFANPNEANRWLKKSRKMVYMGHRRWLPLRHAFRRKKKIFNGKKELGSAPADLSGDQVHNMVKDITNEFGKKRKRSKEDKKRMWKKKSIFWRLPYWEDLEEMNIRSELQPITDERTGRVYLPPACHTLSKDEKIAMLSCLADIKVPSGYCARIIAIRGILPPQVRHTIQRLCAFFNAIGQKIIDPEDLDGLQADIVSTLCHLEMYFPLAFFDIMVHLTVHLVKQTKICGPAFMREMWPFERYMGILKFYVQNRAKPEGSIIEGYTTEEAIEFCIDYMAETDSIRVPTSRHEGRLAGVGTTGRKRIVPDQASYAQAHFAVLQHMAEVTLYFEEHLAKVRQDNIGRSDIWINREHGSRFNEWFKDRVARSTDGPSEILQRLARGLSWDVDTWQGYDINGYTVYTVTQDVKSTVQNSGVHLDAYQDQAGSSTYYGRIEQIWELNYLNLKVPLFRCSWVNIRTGVKVDKEGFTLVDLAKVGYAD
uniref:Transposon protein n=2 Tax=Oryza sativa subsp. japonica TaxID=39947 RepID=Q7G4J9_ORYSJ|nr:putative transposon protein [Oryza sativa Japonica Group]AAP52582.1 transposon protein, putative, CACTA, En/Spm sub-class [Oryza sativa Japonica Group]